MFKPPLESRVQKDLEFDAPQWVDLAKEKDESEAGNVIWSPSRDIHDIWFQEIHPLHEEKTENNSKSTQADQCRKTIKDRKGKTNSLNILKPGLSSRTVSSVAGDVSLNGKSLTQKTRGSDDGSTVVKKPRKCWNLDECSSLSFSPQNSTIPEDMLPKRVSSLTTNSCPMSPGRSSRDRSSADKSNCKPMRRSQKLPHQNDPASPVKSTLGKNTHATKNTNYQKDTVNKNKNTKSCEESVSTDIEKEFNEMRNSSNKRIMEKRAQYDENGRRIRKGNPETCPAPTEIDTKSTKAIVKGKRRSADIVGANRPKEAKQKRRSCMPLSSVKESSKTLHQKPTTRKSTVSNISSHTAKSEETKTKGNLTRQTSFKTAPKSSIKLSNRYGK